MNNGLYNGLDNGFHNGLYEGVFNGLNDGLILENNVIDIDAFKFITEARLTNIIHKIAINGLFKKLKIYGIWDRIIAGYPLIGGNSYSHKYNIKNPNDSNAAFRLDFFGNCVHSSNGIHSGTNGYFLTYVFPSTNLLLNDTHLCTYGDVPSGGIAYNIGVFDGTKSLYQRQSLSSTDGACNNTFGTVAATLNKKMIIHSRNNSANWQRYEEGVKINVTATSGALSALNIPVCALNNGGTIANFSNQSMRYVSIGKGLTDQQAIDYTRIIKEYQQLLNRSL
jgi:hypothetical protein